VPKGACPNCGREDALTQCEVVPAFARIAFVTIPDGGTPSIEWEGSTELDWDGQRPEAGPPTYSCRACYKTFTEFMVVEDAHPDGMREMSELVGFDVD